MYIKFRIENWKWVAMKLANVCHKVGPSLHVNNIIFIDNHKNKLASKQTNCSITLGESYAPLSSMCSNGSLEFITKWPQWGASSTTTSNGVRVWRTTMWLNNSPIHKNAHHPSEMHGHYGCYNPNIGFITKCGV